MKFEDFVYPSYDLPLRSAFDNRFECVYAILHPFVKVSREAAELFSAGPSLEVSSLAGLVPSIEAIKQARAVGERFSWQRIGIEAGLRTYSEINHGLLTMIRALKVEYENSSACEAIDHALTGTCVWIPDEGGFVDLLQEDMLSAFDAAGAEEVVFVPEFPQMDPVQYFQRSEFSVPGRNFPKRGTLMPQNASFLFVVDWDSFFTLLYGPTELVSGVVVGRQIEGFFLDETISHYWWRDSIPIPGHRP